VDFGSAVAPAIRCMLPAHAPPATAAPAAQHARCCHRRTVRALTAAARTTTTTIPLCLTLPRGSASFRWFERVALDAFAVLNVAVAPPAITTVRSPRLPCCQPVVEQRQVNAHLLTPRYLPVVCWRAWTFLPCGQVPFVLAAAFQQKHLLGVAVLQRYAVAGVTLLPHSRHSVNSHRMNIIADFLLFCLFGFVAVSFTFTPPYTGLLSPDADCPHTR